MGTRVGIDTGGTFTDVVAVGPSGRRVLKLPSTPADPARAVLDGLAAVLDEGDSAPRVHHGTTVATNAVLTRTGGRVCFVTTHGFEDLLLIDRGHRRDLHALSASRPAPLVERRDCFGLAERVDAAGRVLDKPTVKELAALRRAVERRRPDAVAVCLLHAPRNSAHERAVAKALKGAVPLVFLSHEAGADPREVERATTTVLDAYVAPIVVRYIARLAEALPRGALSVLRSDAGRMAPDEVARAPGRTLLSGPAAGVAAARDLLVAHGVDAGLTFDVGGTSTDVAWIEGDDLPLGPTLSVGPFTSSVPSVALETVGAGGGSIVSIDAGGALRVGPQSAGADPGPACYGNGGPFALTDAWSVLGRVPTALLGGGFSLDRSAARAAAKRVAAGRLGVPALCRGAVRVAATTTARALRAASAARGNDPRGAVLVAFGGAGPTLACETAMQLGLTTVLVPTDPGLFAAQGALVSPLRVDRSRVAPRGEAALRRALMALERDVRKRLAKEGATHVRLIAEVDARYSGQAFEVTVPFSGWERRFHDAHARRFGFQTPERDVTCVRLRVRGEGREPGLGHRASRVGSVSRFRTRRIERRGRTRPSILREDLGVGARVHGPLRIDETTGTTYVPEGWLAEVLADRTLRLRRQA